MRLSNKEVNLRPWKWHVMMLCCRAQYVVIAMVMRCSILESDIMIVREILEKRWREF